MAKGSIGPGDDVEAWCTRCRMNLEHRVIAVVGSDIKRVHCLTCGGDHAYHPPKTNKPAEKSKRYVKVSGGAKTSRSARAAENEWATFMKEMPEDATPRPYRMIDSYNVAEYLEHPTFGTGRVLEILGQEKIHVVFKEGRKVLICNRKPRPRESG